MHAPLSVTDDLSCSLKIETTHSPLTDVIFKRSINELLRATNYNFPTRGQPFDRSVAIGSVFSGEIPMSQVMI